MEADYFFQANEKANSEIIAKFFYDLALHYQEKGKKKLDVFFDGNSTHKKKMQGIFYEMSKNLKIKVEFHFISAYSPKLNLVEYVIHWIRQKVLHHSDSKRNLEYFVQRIESLCKDCEILSKEQIINILCHIESLID